MDRLIADGVVWTDRDQGFRATADYSQPAYGATGAMHQLSGAAASTLQWHHLLPVIVYGIVAGCAFLGAIERRLYHIADGLQREHCCNECGAVGHGAARDGTE